MISMTLCIFFPASCTRALEIFSFDAYIFRVSSTLTRSVVTSRLFLFPFHHQAMHLVVRSFIFGTLFHFLFLLLFISRFPLAFYVQTWLWYFLFNFILFPLTHLFFYLFWHIRTKPVADKASLIDFVAPPAATLWLMPCTSDAVTVLNSRRNNNNKRVPHPYYKTSVKIKKIDLKKTMMAEES